MNILITSKGNNLDAGFDLRFGRAGYYCIYDDESGKSTFHENEFKDAQGGAGTKAAEYAVTHNVKMILSGDFGPKAKDLLEQFKIQMVMLQDEDTPISEIIKKIK